MIKILVLSLLSFIFIGTIDAAESNSIKPSNIKVDTTLNIPRSTQEYIIKRINSVESGKRYDEISKKIIELTQFRNKYASQEQKNSIDKIIPYLKKIQAQLKSEQKSKIPSKIPPKKIK